MNRITFPLKIGMKGQAVADLQDGLRLLLVKGIIQMDDADRQAFEERLQAERAEQIYDNGTDKLVALFQAQQHRDPIGEVDEATAKALNDAVAALQSQLRIVQGQVHTADRQPLVGVVVRAYNKGLRSEEFLGENPTDSDGRYVIPYDTALPDEKNSVNLRVCVFDREEKERASSPIRFNAPRDLVVDLVAPITADVLSEYERYLVAITPLLTGQGAGGADLNLAELTEDDIDFIAGDTGIEHQHVAWMTLSAHRSRETITLGPKPGPHGIRLLGPMFAAQVFYAWFRQKLPTELALLFAERPEALQQALQASIDANFVPAALRETIAHIIGEQLPAWLAHEALKSGGLEGTASLGDLLDTIETREKLSEDEQLLFAKLRHVAGNTEQLWEQVKKSTLVPKIATLQRTMLLSDITLAHRPLITALQALHDPAAPESTAYLATLSRKQWFELAFTHGVPPGSKLSPVEYALQLEQAVEDRFPTVVLRERLQSGALAFKDFPKERVVQILSEHRDFDVRAEKADAFLARIGANTPELSEALRGVQRLLPYAGSINATAQLWNKGYRSAYAIAQAGSDQFVAQLVDALPAERLRTIHAAAQETTVKLLALASTLSPRFNRQAIVPMPPPMASAALLTKYPNLRVLFGALDYCECPHCQSVLSPAAYLTDLLHFLQQIEATGGNALGALCQRRPDLVDLDLSCENTNIEIPYIDLVLEVLENAVALPMVIGIAPGGFDTITSEFQKKSVPERIRQALSSTAITLGNNWTATARDPSLTLFPWQSDWTITDGSRRWTVGYAPSVLVFLKDRLASWRSFENIDAIISELNNHRLHPDLMSYLIPEAIPPLVTQTVNAAQQSGTWEISLIRGIVIEIKPGGPQVAIRFYSLDDTFLTELSISVVEAQLVNAWLQGQSDKGIEVVLSILQLPIFPYERIFDAAMGKWVLGIRQTFVLLASQEKLLVTALTYQNSSIKSDLAAVPENRNPAAYERLREAVFPWTLPLDLWIMEIRVYLQELGISRRRLLEIAQPLDANSTAYRAEIGLFSLAELLSNDLLITPQVFGLNEHGNDLYDVLAGAQRQGNWLNVLQWVSMLMQQSGLSYRELLDVLQTSIRGATKPSIENLTDDQGACCPSKMRVKNGEIDHLNWLYGFTRAWRSLGWSMRELDRFSTLWIRQGKVLVPGIILRLQERLNQPILSLTAMLGYMEGQAWIEHTKDGTPTMPSLYVAVFQRNALRPSASYSAFMLNVHGNELQYLDHPNGAHLKISDHAEFVAAALGIQAVEVRQIFDPKSKLGIPDQLQLDNLTTLYGIASFCHSLRIDVDDFIRWTALLNLNPFAKTDANARAEDLLKFVEDFDFVKQAGSSLDELEYLLCHSLQGTFKDVKGKLFAPLTELRSALQSGTVLGNSSLENLLIQLRKVGVSEALITALSSDAALAALLKVEIDIDPAPAQLPEMPNDLVNHFYYIQEGAASKGRLGCSGIIADDAEFTKLPISLAPWTDILKARYTLIRDILFSQMQSFPTPVFVAKTVVPTPALRLPDDMSAFLRYQTDNQLQLIGFITQAQGEYLKKELPGLADQFQELIDQSMAFTGSHDLLAKETIIDLLTTRADEMTRSVLIRLVPALETDLVKAQVSALLDLEPLLTETLLQTVKVAVDGAKSGFKTAYELLTSEELLRSDAKKPMDDKVFTLQIQALYRLDKVARLLRGKGIAQDQLQWFRGDLLPTFDFNELPATDGAAALTFNVWRDFQQVLRFRDRVEGGAVTVQKLVDMLENPPPTADDVHTLFADAYHLPKSEIAAACTPELLNLHWSADFQREPADFQRGERLLHLVEFLHVLKLLGTTVQTIAGMIQEKPTAADAMAARQLFMAQFDGETLTKRLQPISDKLRVMQRDALTSYLVAHNQGQFPDANALLDYYLIDVKMEPCMRTSRIKQAISSVQLFIQRCQLNLERNTVSPKAIDGKQLRWMKNYRVWEVNRKVFLNPEDWIEPELRDNKTEIFRQLESKLLQENLTHEASLDAFRGYLEQAAEIARLTVVALWEEALMDEDGHKMGKTVHILATNDGKPRHHYYRQLTLKGETASWTPWETIDGEINSEHVFIFKLGGFLNIVYAEIKPDESNTRWKVSLAVRRKGREGWTTAQKSKEEIPHSMVPNKDERTSFFFHLSEVINQQGTATQINCYGASSRYTQPNTGDLVIEKYYDKDEQANSWQDLKANLRILEKFKDSRDIWYWGRTTQEIHLIASLTYSYVYKDGNRLIRTVENPLPYVSRTYFGGCAEFEYNLPYEFRDSNKKGQDSDIPISDEIFGYNGIRFHFTSLKIVAFGTPELHKESRQEFLVDLSEMASGLLSHDLVFERKEKVESTPAESADRQLEFEPLGIFNIDENLTIFLLDKKTEPNATLPFDGTEYFCSGYQKVTEQSGKFYIDRYCALRQTNGKYFITTTNERSVWAYKDNRFRLYFLRGQDGRYRVLPEGQDWIYNGLRRLARQEQSDITLDQLSAPLSLTDNKIPWDDTCAGINGEASAKELTLAFASNWPASAYDWEVFFHTPLLIATQLSKAQRFEEAQRWFHTIFDPTTDDPGILFSVVLKSAEELNYPNTLDRGILAPGLRQEFEKNKIWLPEDDEIKIDRDVQNNRWQIDAASNATYFVDKEGTNLSIGDESIRYWRFPPFRQAGRGQSIDQVLTELAKGNRSNFTDEINAWKENPFNPHLVARFRIRSYQWATILKYLDNLIAWADQLFRRDTIESINEATQLYILAARILGPRLISIPKGIRPTLSYLDLQNWGLDEFSNAWVGLEDLVGPWKGTYTSGDFSPPPLKIMLYFCIPSNDLIETLWDTVEDRLFNIRHCRNIDGVERRLPLFEPPIDPALLVKAAAAGLDLSTVLADLASPLPLYRFNVILQKAVEICAEVKALGGALLSALEKKDAEQLALLRSSHEIDLLTRTKEVRQQQIEEAKLTLAGLTESRKTAVERFKHYQLLLGRTEIAVPQLGQSVSLEPVPLNLAKSGLDSAVMGLGITQTEKEQLKKLGEAQIITLAAGIFNAAAGIAFGLGTIPFTAETAQTIGHSINAVASALNAVSGYLGAEANRDAIIGGYERRRDEWVFQSNMALRELQQIDKQIAAAEIRSAITEKELSNLQQQLENTQAVDEAMHSKYTNQQLYQWMSGQLSSIYFRSYQFAHELAKRAERCFQFELGVTNTSYINFGYWDSLRKGLLASEQLYQDLKRLDVAYLERNKREYELTKHVSLLQLDPVALITLRQTGRCEISMPEMLFDLDCPGHFMRRIKSVGVSIPCVTGPYTGVHCTLTLLSSVVRKVSTLSGDAYGIPSAEDERFRFDYSSIQSIVTSSGQGDSGLFETNLRDERYLPFEGAGALSTWRLELPSEFRQFDYDTISDVILHIRYTAREGGERLRKAAIDHITDIVSNAQTSGCMRLFSLRSEFPNEWHRFTTKAKANGDQCLFSVDSSFVSTLDSGELSQELRDVFQGQNKQLTGAAKVTVEQSGNKWTIDDIGVEYLIRNETKTLKVYDVYIQAFTLSKERFPLLFQGRTITITNIDLYGVPEAGASTNEDQQLTLTLMTPDTNKVQLQDGAVIGQLIHKTGDKINEGEELKVEVKSAKANQSNWSLMVQQGDVSELDRLADIIILCHYQVGEH